MMSLGLGQDTVLSESWVVGHILSGCLQTLGNSRYCHDQVLQVIVEVISTGISSSKHQQSTRQSIAFVGQSFIRTLKMLGIKGLQYKNAIKEITDMAEKALIWLWIKHTDLWP